MVQELLLTITAELHSTKGQSLKARYDTSIYKEGERSEKER